MFDASYVLGVGARLQARRIDETLKNFIGSLFVATTTTDLADTGNLPMDSYVERWKPEIDACLDLTFYTLSTSYKASPGMKIFGLSYSKKGNSMALLACIVCKWLYCRIHRISIYKHWREAAEGTLQKKLWRMIKVLDAVVQILSFANNLSFFSATSSASEAYPDLTSRVSGYGWARVPLTASDSASSSSLSRDSAKKTHSDLADALLTRPLPIPSATPGTGSGSGSGSGSRGSGSVLSSGRGASRAEGQQLTRLIAWQAVQGLVLAVALLLDWRHLGVTAKRYVIDLYYRSSHFLKQRFSLATLYNSVLIPKYIPEFLLQFLKPAVNSGGGSGGDSVEGAVCSSSTTAVATRDDVTDHDACAICGLSSPEAPHAGECGHVCCFHCLASNVRLGRFRCPTCGVLLTCCDRL